MDVHTREGSTMTVPDFVPEHEGHGVSELWAREGDALRDRLSASAPAMKGYFDALVVAGFNAEQALALACSAQAALLGCAQNAPLGLMRPV